MMKITFVIDSLQHGGAERVITNLARGLSTLGHEISILVLSAYGNCSFYKIKDDVNVSSLLKKKDEKISKIRKIYRLRQVMKKDKDMLYIAFLPHICIYVYLASLFLKSNYFVSERSDPSRYSKMYKFFLKRAFKKALGSVFQSQQSKRFYFKNDERKTKIIVNPVHLENIEKVKGEKEKKILSVGRLMEEKNFPLLIESFKLFLKEYPEYVLEIFGDGPLKNNLIKLIEDIGLKERVLLKGTDPDWHSKCINYSCYVCSSDYEGMSNSLEEAACMGLPCVSTDCPSGGNKELLNYGEFGILVPVGDANELCHAMVKTIKNSLVYDNMKLLEKCSLENVSLEWEKFLLDCLKRNQIQ